MSVYAMIQLTIHDRARFFVLVEQGQLLERAQVGELDAQEANRKLPRLFRAVQLHERFLHRGFVGGGLDRARPIDGVKVGVA